MSQFGYGGQRGRDALPTGGKPTGRRLTRREMRQGDRVVFWVFVAVILGAGLLLVFGG